MNTKIILAITALAVVAAALAAVATIQFVGAQTQNQTAPQLVQLPNGQYAYAAPANNGTIIYTPCDPYGATYGTQLPAQQTAPYVGGYGYGGMGMYGRFW